MDEEREGVGLGEVMLKDGVVVVVVDLVWMLKGMVRSCRIFSRRNGSARSRAWRQR
jgi:hypothetical protein